MSEKRIIEGMKEAVAVARGERPAARIHANGHAYIPEALEFRPPIPEPVWAAMVERGARSDAAFDGREFSTMGRADRSRYTARAEASLRAALGLDRAAADSRAESP